MCCGLPIYPNHLRLTYNTIPVTHTQEKFFYQPFFFNRWMILFFQIPGFYRNQTELHLCSPDIKLTHYPIKKKKKKTG